MGDPTDSPAAIRIDMGEEAAGSPEGAAAFLSSLPAPLDGYGRDALPAEGGGVPPAAAADRIDALEVSVRTRLLELASDLLGAGDGGGGAAEAGGGGDARARGKGRLDRGRTWFGAKGTGERARRRRRSCGRARSAKYDSHLAAKKASTFLMKNCSLSVRLAQSLASCARSSSSAVQKLASAFLYMSQTGVLVIGKSTNRFGFSVSKGSSGRVPSSSCCLKIDTGIFSVSASTSVHDSSDFPPYKAAASCWGAANSMLKELAWRGDELRGNSVLNRVENG